MPEKENNETKPTEQDSTIPFTKDMPVDEENQSIDETVQWEEGFNLRAMTSTFIMLVIWIVFWGWLCFKVFNELAEPRYRNVNMFIAETDEDADIEKIGHLKDSAVVKQMEKDDAARRKVLEDELAKEQEEKKGSKEAEALADKEIILESDVVREAVLIKQMTEEERKNWTKFYKKVNGKTYITEKKYNTFSDPLEKSKWVLVKTQFAFLGENNVNLYIFLVIAGIPFLMILYRAIYKKISVSYVLTDYRLLIREGLFVKREYQIRLIQIKDLAVYQGLIQLVLNVGTIHVFSNDADTPDINLDGIREPVKRKETIFKISEQKKKSKEFYMGQA